ncbi:hypothetical protein SAMN04487926_10819 [Paraburkholderia steynii]|uniref:Uncharacterized protein n=1 Tax=Paraburkholderia steynii TaxID=1245441 RepID=A0A7Z7B6T7_9BURK|nr:hypothetical protein SAMN04487926_10819 [Paraburkholderia steynii]
MGAPKKLGVSELPAVLEPIGGESSLAGITVQRIRIRTITFTFPNTMSRP